MTDETRFAPARRSGQETLARQTGLFSETLTTAVLDALPTGTLILNADRQIVYCNPVFQRLTGELSLAEILGLRPGEALGCIHSELMEGGCGTSDFCRHCGAAKAILDSLDGHPSIEECRMLRRSAPPEEHAEDALNLQVYASPLTFEGERYSLFAILDVSFERRLDMVETFFFGEVLADIGTLGNLADMLRSETPPELREYGTHLKLVVERIREGITAHRDLGRAESGDFSPSPEEVRVRSLLEQAAAHAQDSRAATGRSVVVDSGCPEDMRIETDPLLLGRVLMNLLVNALEAVPPGEQVRLGCRALPESRGQGLEISVHNSGTMDEAVQAQVFKRSFSTKGKGRGLGLFAARMYLLRHLNGSLDFESTPENGTTFTVRLPF